MAQASKPLAFCDAHKAGACDLAWSGDALVTCGPDGRLCYREPGRPSEVKREAQNENNGAAAALTALHSSPKDGRLAACDDQCFVKVCAWAASQRVCRTCRQAALRLPPSLAGPAHGPSARAHSDPFFLPALLSTCPPFHLPAVLCQRGG
jgi:hypothetical protein